MQHPEVDVQQAAAVMVTLAVPVFAVIIAVLALIIRAAGPNHAQVHKPAVTAEPN